MGASNKLNENVGIISSVSMGFGNEFVIVCTIFFKEIIEVNCIGRIGIIRKYFYFYFSSKEFEILNNFVVSFPTS